MSKKERAIQLLDDIEMRRGLMEFLWQFRKDAQGETPRPCPMMDDKEIKEELFRILLD